MELLNPRESAKFIASVAENVIINPDGIKSVAHQVTKRFAIMIN